MNHGERRAARHYRLRGYSVIDANVRSGGYELDLVLRAPRRENVGGKFGTVVEPQRLRSAVDDEQLLQDAHDAPALERDPHRDIQSFAIAFVEDHDAEAIERARSLVDHVSQHLGRHHHDGCVGVDGVVPREQADAVTAVHAPEVMELLVGERLDRGCVEGLLAARHGRCDGVLGDERLTRSGRCRDQHRPADVDAVERPSLELVEGEPDALLEPAARVAARLSRRRHRFRTRPMTITIS